MTLPKSHFEPIDDYEKDLIKSLENDEFVEVPNWKKDIKFYQKVAVNTLKKLKKDKNINIRLPETDLTKIKTKAQTNGLPYQTLISTLIHQYATGKINLIL